jgi:hypothetical protein
MWIILVGISIALAVEGFRQHKELDSFLDEKNPAEK